MTGRHNLLLIAGGMSLALLTGCNESGRPLADGTAGPAFNGEAPAMGVVQGSSYIVAPGDSLGTIADRTNTPIRTLIDLNHLVPPYRVQAGTRLLLQPRSNYVVRAGDTIQKIAQSQGVSQSALIQLNGLSAPYALRTGQSLILPSGMDASSSPTNVAVGQSFVMPAATPDGSTAPTTAPSSGVSKAALPPLPSAKATGAQAAGTQAATNATGAPEVLAPATTAAAKKIETQPMSAATNQVQAAQTQVQSAQTQAAQAQSQAQTQAQSQAQAAKNQAASNLPPPADPVMPPDPFFADDQGGKSSATTPTTTQTAAKPVTAATGNGQFGWPVQGNVISKFGATADGLRNDGINIAAPAGAPVQAAADGVVAYAGNELRGFGNMVLIRHPNGWVTAYAHNQSLTVKKGDQVKRGQTIARVGSTGNVQSPQLHFEIRKGTSAVDPMKYLGS